MLPVDMSIWVKAAISIFIFLGIILFILGIRRVWRRRVITGSLEGLVGLLFIALAVLTLAISINLYTYDRLTYEEVIAEVQLESIGPQHFEVQVTSKKGVQVFELRGDEWQMDALVLKWRGLAVLLGFDTVYRLDRMSGRYWEISQEKTGPRTVYSLSEQQGPNLWMMVKKYNRWVPWVDALYGSATYLPMVDGATYTVSVSNTGLLARPNNDIAQKAVSGWR